MSKFGAGKSGGFCSTHNMLSGSTVLANLARALRNQTPQRSSASKRASVCLILRINQSLQSHPKGLVYPSAGLDLKDFEGNNIEGVFQGIENRKGIDDGYQDTLECLFIKRADIENDPWSGQVALPGGKQEEQDDSNDFKTAVREAQEEVGLNLGDADQYRYLGPMNEREITGHGKIIKGFAMVPHVFLHMPGLNERPKIFAQEGEVAGARWTDLNVLRPSNISWDRIRREYYWDKGVQKYKQGKYAFPSIRLPSEGDATCTEHLDFTLWGLTYGVLSDAITMGGGETINDPPFRKLEDR